MFGGTRTTLRLAAYLLLVAGLSVGSTARTHLRHCRRHIVEAADSSSCPDRCVCRPVGDVPCDWCAQTADEHGQDGRVSCDGCSYGTAEQVRDAKGRNFVLNSLPEFLGSNECSAVLNCISKLYLSSNLSKLCLFSRFLYR